MIGHKGLIFLMFFKKDKTKLNQFKELVKQASNNLVYQFYSDQINDLL